MGRNNKRAGSRQPLGSAYGERFRTGTDKVERGGYVSGGELKPSRIPVEDTPTSQARIAARAARTGRGDAKNFNYFSLTRPVTSEMAAELQDRLWDRIGKSGTSRARWQVRLGDTLQLVLVDSEDVRHAAQAGNRMNRQATSSETTSHIIDARSEPITARAGRLALVQLRDGRSLLRAYYDVKRHGNQEIAEDQRLITEALAHNLSVPEERVKLTRPYITLASTATDNLTSEAHGIYRPSYGLEAAQFTLGGIQTGVKTGSMPYWQSYGEHRIQPGQPHNTEIIAAAGRLGIHLAQPDEIPGAV